MPALIINDLDSDMQRNIAQKDPERFLWIIGIIAEWYNRPFELLISDASIDPENLYMDKNPISMKALQLVVKNYDHARTGLKISIGDRINVLKAKEQEGSVAFDDDL